MSPKRAKYHQRFCHKWTTKKEFQNWLKPLPSHDDRAYCSICHVVIKAHLVDLRKHGTSKKHMNAVKLHNSLKVEDAFYQHDSISVEANPIQNEIADAEFFISEENDDDLEDKDFIQYSKWTFDAVKTLLSHVKHFWKDLQGGLRKKKDVWEDIQKFMVEGGYDYSSVECAKKFRNIKQRFFTVLERKMLGDKNPIRIDYFDELNELLANDPETLAYLESRKLAVSIELQSTYDDDEENSQTGEIEWNDVATCLFLDLLLEFKDWFSSKEEDIDTIWGIIADQMKKEGFSLDQIKCKKKWQNLCSVYNHFKSLFDSTGTLPMWQYYTKVRHVLNTVDIPTEIKENSTTSKLIYQNGSRPAKRAKLLENDSEASGIDDDDSESEHNQKYTVKQLKNQLSKMKSSSSSVLKMVNKMKENAIVWQRLNQIESQLDDLSDFQETQRNTNLLLTQILAELSTLSSHLVPRNQDQDPLESKNGITIVVPQTN